MVIVICCSVGGGDGGSSGGGGGGGATSVTRCLAISSVICFWISRSHLVHTVYSGFVWRFRLIQYLHHPLPPSLPPSLAPSLPRASTQHE